MRMLPSFIPDPTTAPLGRPLADRLGIADIYRRKARNLAWYDQEGEPSTHNPFKKFRARPRRSSSIKLESRLAPVRTAGEVPLSEERRRRRDMTDGLEGPEHSDSFPPESSLSRLDQESHVRPNTASITRAESSGDIGEEDRPDPSMHSREPINVSFQDEGDIEGGKPRKRRTLLGKWRNHEEDNDDEVASASTEDGDDKEEDKQKFTLAGQLKATIFNSWMNILILAAPVGSEFPNCFYIADC